MVETAMVLAEQARRAALIQAVRGRPGLTIEQLQALIAKGAYAEELQAITVSELLRPHSIHSSALEIKSGESLEAAILRVFHQLPDRQLTSGFFCRYMGLERWTAQKVLAEMADRGLLVRSGKTSGTRYVLADEPDERPCDAHDEDEPGLTGSRFAGSVLGEGGSMSPARRANRRS